MSELMTAKEYLMQIKKCNIEIENLKDSISEIENQMSGLASHHKFDSKSSTINNKSPQDKFIYILMNHQIQLSNKIEELYALKSDVIILIEKLENADQMDVLYKKYVLCYSWNTIADKKFVTPRAAQKIHKKALIAFNKIYERVRTSSH